MSAFGTIWPLGFVTAVTAAEDHINLEPTSYSENMLARETKVKERLYGAQETERSQERQVLGSVQR